MLPAPGRGSRTPTGGGGGGGKDAVILAVPLAVPLVAVIVVVPAFIAVTRPVPETVAIPEFALDHEIARPVNTLPLASRVTTARLTVPPVRMLDDAGETVTDATATGVVVVTERVAAPTCPPLDAVIWATPAASAVTRPESDGIAALMLLDVQTTSRPVSTLLLASRIVALA